jgi:hypothetical protein
VCPAIALIVAIGFSGVARGDGDPASDVLSSQRLFVAQDARVPSAQLVKLAELLNAARARGYPLRVAVIASRTDLGSVTALWRRPASYAQFLGQELSLVSSRRDAVLIVMPDGFGLYRAGGTTAAERGALTAIPGAPGAAGLGDGALRAIEGLAAAAGRPLPRPSVAATSDGGGGESITSWVVFAVGAALIAAAWGASLRARPPSRVAWLRRSEGSG